LDLVHLLILFLYSYYTKQFKIYDTIRNVYFNKLILFWFFNIEAWCFFIYKSNSRSFLSLSYIVFLFISSAQGRWREFTPVTLCTWYKYKSIYNSFLIKLYKWKVSIIKWYFEYKYYINLKVYIIITYFIL
jgi:hypothetical protein